MSLETIGEQVSRSLASTFTRKSFLAKIGLGSLVAFGGSVASDLFVEVAYASHGCPGCANCGYSVQCESYGATGSSCPSGSCSCGYWQQCAGCSGRWKRFKDCCCGCGGGCRCRDGWPTCCYTAPYATCNGCNHVKCRQIFCTSTAC